MTRSIGALLAAISACLVISSPVVAQDSALAEGIAHFEAGDFDAAQEDLDRALWETSLDVEEFQQLLVYRATVALAREDQAGADQDLLRLASLDPEYPFDRSTPPQVRESFERAAGRVNRPLSLRIDHREEGGRVTIDVRAVSDIAGLVRSARVFARVGEGEYEGGDDTITVEAGEASSVSYYAEAVGPGDSIVIREGSEQGPRTIPLGSPGLEVEEEEGSNTALWVTLVVVGLLAVGGGILAAVLLTQGQETSVQPMVRF